MAYSVVWCRWSSSFLRTGLQQSGMVTPLISLRCGCAGLLWWVGCVVAGLVKHTLISYHSIGWCCDQACFSWIERRLSVTNLSSENNFSWLTLPFLPVWWWFVLLNADLKGSHCFRTAAAIDFWYTTSKFFFQLVSVLYFMSNVHIVLLCYFWLDRTHRLLRLQVHVHE